MTIEPEELFELDRSFKGFLDRAWINLNDISVSLDTHEYLYAALDLRLGIERLLSILLMTISIHNGDNPKKSLYRVKHFVQAMKNIDINYEAKLEEILITARAIHNLSFPKIDIRELDKIYGKLGTILHLNDFEVFYIETQEQLTDIEQLVLESYDYLNEFRYFDKLMDITK